MASQRTFGLELEFSFGCLGCHGDVEYAQDIISTNLRGEGLHAVGGGRSRGGSHAWYAYYEAGVEYNLWEADTDITISLETRDFKFSDGRMKNPQLPFWIWNREHANIELRSRILRQPFWEEVQISCDVLNHPEFEILQNRSTSVHVHIGVREAESIRAADTDAEEEQILVKRIRRLACCIYLFEEFLFFLLPPHRQNYYSRRVRYNPYLRGKSNTQVCNELLAQQNVKEVYDIINCDTVAPNGNSRGGYRHHSFNFSRVDYLTHTVEVRMHEGSTDHAELECWTKLCMRIVDRGFATQEDSILLLSQRIDDIYDMAGNGSIDAWGPNRWSAWADEMQGCLSAWLAGPRLLEKLSDDSELEEDPEDVAPIYDREGSLVPQSDDEAEIDVAMEDWAPDDDGNGDGDDSNDPKTLEYIRRERVLHTEIMNYVEARKQKFLDKHKAYIALFPPNQLDEPNDAPPDDDDEYENAANPSGIVLDANGNDIPIRQF